MILLFETYGIFFFKLSFWQNIVVAVSLSSRDSASTVKCQQKPLKVKKGLHPANLVDYADMQI